MAIYNRIESALIHGGIFGDELTHSVNVPIHQTSTYQQFELEGNPKWEYSRTGNPTRAALEALIAELEGGRFGFAFASGMAAITTVLQLFKSGDRILISSNVYGGTYRVLDKVFKQFGLKYDFVDTSDIASIEAAITGDVRAILIESPANPLMTITDIAAVSALAKARGVLSIVDNTFMTPYLQRPLKLGADIVIHSATKYLGGHSDLVAGLVVVNDEAMAQRLAFIQNAVGGVLGPFDAFLLIRGIKTLAVRMDRHVENAERIAHWLAGHEAVARVYYPGLESDPGYAVNRRQAKNGGAMIAFTLKDDYNYRTFFKSLKLILLAESLGGVESLICHPSTMTHASIPRDIRLRVGISDNLIRLSPGIEAAEDLINDLEQAIAASKED
ncbi:MAG: trans-sulfuration enzyme family protein [bacterium]